MNGCTINIADFPALRAMNERRIHSVPTSIDRTCRVITLAPSNASSTRESDSRNQSASVHDISEIREARGIDHRILFGSGVRQRRARVLRFGDSEIARSGEQRGVKSWSCSPDPIDCPPAA